MSKNFPEKKKDHHVHNVTVHRVNVLRPTTKMHIHGYRKEGHTTRAMQCLESLYIVRYHLIG